MSLALVSGITKKSIERATRIATAHSLGAMNSLVIVERSGAYDDVMREYDAGAVEVIYDNPDPLLAGSGGIAGVSPTQGPDVIELGDEIQAYDTINLYLPSSMPKLARRNDLVTIVMTPDVDLVGRVFKIVTAEVGGRIYSSNHFVASGIAPGIEQDA